MNATRVGLLGDATFSDDGHYRYRLTRLVNPVRGERRAVCWIMLNPSTADENASDATVARVVRFSAAWGYHVAVVVNLFALRATEPWRLEGGGDPVGPDNDLYILQEAQAAERVIVAWGTHRIIRRTGRDLDVLRLLDNASRMVFALRTTKDGSPAHPLYLPRTSAPMEYSARRRKSAADLAAEAEEEGKR
jgi:hypothetical protein